MIFLFYSKNILKCTKGNKPGEDVNMEVSFEIIYVGVGTSSSSDSELISLQKHVCGGRVSVPIHKRNSCEVTR